MATLVCWQPNPANPLQAPFCSSKDSTFIDLVRYYPEENSAENA
ncbi:hypothetical protein IWQ48_003173 [Labrenzia sp. EL_13]|nr:hypothetical protein [Labrenzia sp. EL_13]